jgi:hypothetical protein
MLSFSCTRIGEQDLLLPYAGHIVFTTVAGQGWLAGPKPSLDAPWHLANVYVVIKGQHGILRDEVARRQREDGSRSNVKGPSVRRRRSTPG